MTFYVYIIYSVKLQRFYIGTTDNISQRLSEHNSAKYSGSFTEKGIPWELYFSIECNSSQQAYKLEKFIKKMHSSVFIKKLKVDPELLEGLLKRFE